MKRVASPGSMHATGCLGLVHWDDPEGWNGEGGGRRVQDGEHMYTCGGFILDKTLESPLDCKAIQPDHPEGNQCSLEGLMVKLNLQYFGDLMQRTDSFEKFLVLGNIEIRR